MANDNNSKDATPSDGQGMDARIRLTETGTQQPGIQLTLCSPEEDYEVVDGTSFQVLTEEEVSTLANLIMEEKSFEEVTIAREGTENEDSTFGTLPQEDVVLEANNTVRTDEEILKDLNEDDTQKLLALLSTKHCYIEYEDEEEDDEYSEDSVVTACLHIPLYSPVRVRVQSANRGAGLSPLSSTAALSPLSSRANLLASPLSSRNSMASPLCSRNTLVSPLSPLALLSQRLARRRGGEKLPSLPSLLPSLASLDNLLLREYGTQTSTTTLLLSPPPCRQQSSPRTSQYVTAPSSPVLSGRPPVPSIIPEEKIVESLQDIMQDTKEHLLAKVKEQEQMKQRQRKAKKFMLREQIAENEQERMMKRLQEEQELEEAAQLQVQEMWRQVQERDEWSPCVQCKQRSNTPREQGNGREKRREEGKSKSKTPVRDILFGCLFGKMKE